MKFKIILLLLGAILSSSFAYVYTASPYTLEENQEEIRTSVMIHQPCEVVFEYLGDSDNARHWSVFVDHISPLNSEQFLDGSVGSQRRCYTSESDSEFYWDEEILAVTKNERRTLKCFNYTNLWLDAPILKTHQIYETKRDGCKLTFTLSTLEECEMESFLKLKLFGFQIADVFEQNLANVKKEVEKFQS